VFFLLCRVQVLSSFDFELFTVVVEDMPRWLAVLAELLAVDFEFEKGATSMWRPLVSASIFSLDNPRDVKEVESELLSREHCFYDKQRRGAATGRRRVDLNKKQEKNKNGVAGILRQISDNNDHCIELVVRKS
jgi:hypothetical protein